MGEFFKVLLVAFPTHLYESLGLLSDCLGRQTDSLVPSLGLPGQWGPAPGPRLETGIQLFLGYEVGQVRRAIVVLGNVGFLHPEVWTKMRMPYLSIESVL